MYSLFNQKKIQVDCDGNIMNDQSISKPGSAMLSQIISSMITQKKCIMDNSAQPNRKICDEVLIYECFFHESQPDPQLESQLEDARVTLCSISIQHFTHCLAFNRCEPKSVTSDAISILEDSFVSYIESSKATSFQCIISIEPLNVIVICNEQTLIKAIKRSYKSTKSFYTLELKGSKLPSNKEMQTEILTTITDALKVDFPDSFVSIQLLGHRVSKLR